MNLKKKLIAAILAVATAVSCTACADTSNALTIDGEAIRAGIYLYYEFQALGDASSALEEEQPDLDTSAEDFNYFAQNIGGMSYSDYVIDATKKLCQQHVYITRQFEELGLSFTDEEKTENNESINSAWNDENALLQYYGIGYDTYGEYYESLGIGKQSFTEVYNASQMEEKIFHATYGEGGSAAVSTDEINTYLTENNARVKYITVDLEDANGDPVETDEGKKILEDMAQGYVDKLSNGTSFNEVYNEYEKFLWDQNEAATLADDETYEVTEYTPEEKEDSEHETVISKTATSPSEEFVSYVFNADFDTATLYKEDTAYYVIVRTDVLSNAEWVETNTESALHSLKGEEFEEAIEAAAATLAVTENAAAIAAYAPDKIDR